MIQELLLRSQEHQQSKSGGSKTMDSKAMFQAIEENPKSSTQRIREV